jgi:hypothetical protein
MKRIGYLEGTDPGFLTKLVCMGHETMPIGNGIDNHGKNIALISSADKVDLIVGYLHKISPLPGVTNSLRMYLTPAIIYNIPMLLLAPKETLGYAKKMLSEVATSDDIKVIDCKNIMDESMDIME